MDNLYIYKSSYLYSDISDLLNDDISFTSYGNTEYCANMATSYSSPYYYLTDFSNNLSSGICNIRDPDKAFDYQDNWIDNSLSSRNICDDNNDSDCLKLITDSCGNKHYYGIDKNISLYTDTNLYLEYNTYELSDIDYSVYLTTYSNAAQTLTDLYNSFEKYKLIWYRCVDISGNDCNHDDILQMPTSELTNYDIFYNWEEIGNLCADTESEYTTALNNYNSKYNTLLKYIYSLDVLIADLENALYGTVSNMKSNVLTVSILNEKIRNAENFLSNLLNSDLGHVGDKDAIIYRKNFKLIQIILVCIVIILVIIIYFKCIN